ncbi:hypothetical protein HXX76_006116 [Chlamydomonas incerta]|uniref:Condensin-2 complex subunit H2 n=1 Tax=Chlamydomonas incerta TaxID=51695 RepID=A0A835TFS8_CHLIN|nr:hypothetical protein HXX76_006116 [Chlamydomonas incerta]|eukprot:KAG2437466.1 hypothetical protein HXX76_006116 [Chlamydomonas incerta]
MEFDDDLNGVESRFAHLLKPIRDLQDNFNIDLAHELEEYLDQLENAQFAFENASSKNGFVDFAEAALLIQGSTCVYSKKVEYLYNLVYQALEAVKGRKRQGGSAGLLGPDGQPLPEGEGGTQAAAAGPRGRAARGGALEEDEEEGLARFWDVEPLLAESPDLDLGPGDGMLPGAAANVRPPAALLALEDHAPTATSGAGGGGGGGGGGGRGDGDSGVYRLQQCVVHVSGALMLDPRDADMYDIQLRFIGPQARRDREGLEELLAAQQQEAAALLGAAAAAGLHPGQQQTAAADGGGAVAAPAQAADTAEAAAAAAAEGGADDPMAAAAADGAAAGEADAGGAAPMQGAAGGFDYDDDGGGGGGYGGGDWPSDDEAAPGDGGDGDAMAVDGQEAAGPDGAAEAGDPKQRPRRAAAAAAGGGVAAAADGDAGQAGGLMEGPGQDEGKDEEDEEELQAFDAFAPLDPSSKSVLLADRPLVVHKPRASRRQHAAATSGATAAGSASLASQLAPGATAAAARAAAAAAARACGCPSLLLPEFAYALSFLRAAAPPDEAAAARKAAEAAARRGRGGRVALAAADEAGPVFDARDAAAAALHADYDDGYPQPVQAGGAGTGAAGADGYGFNDTGDDGGDDFYGGGGGASDLDDDPVGPGGWGEDGGGVEGLEEAAAAGLRANGMRWPAAALDGGGGGEVAAVGGAEQSYEELCRAHMEALMAAAAARVVQSDLARRVSSWRQRIDPVLQAEEARPAFDIQDYGERLLGRLSHLKITDGTSPQADDGQEEEQRNDQAAQAQAAADAGADAAKADAAKAAAAAAVVFSVVARDLQKFEVSRMFSAMLQLINNRNVHIIQSARPAGLPAGEVPDEPFRLQLLSTDLYHKSMKERLAADAAQQLQRPPGGTQQGDADMALALADGGDDDGENHGTQHTQRGGKAAGGRGKAAAAGGAKRAKKAALAEAN